MVESSPYIGLDLDEHSCFQVAVAYQLVGETEKALDWLERGVERGYIGASVFQGFFAGLAAEPRFDTIVAAAREKQEQFSAQLDFGGD
jgi:hypothetical protein